MLTLVRDERDVADHRRLGRQVERGPHVRGLQSNNPFDVHAFVDDRDFGARTPSVIRRSLITRLLAMNPSTCA